MNHLCCKVLPPENVHSTVIIVFALKIFSALNSFAKLSVIPVYWPFLPFLLLLNCPGGPVISLIWTAIHCNRPITKRWQNIFVITNWSFIHQGENIAFFNTWHPFVKLSCPYCCCIGLIVIVLFSFSTFATYYRGLVGNSYPLSFTSSDSLSPFLHPTICDLCFSFWASDPCKQ